MHNDVKTWLKVSKKISLKLKISNPITTKTKIIKNSVHKNSSNNTVIFYNV